MLIGTQLTGQHKELKMKYADTISHHKGAITGSESSSQFNATQSGSINTVHDTCSQLANRTSATNLFIAYVDGGKSTATDWNFSYVRLDAKQKALANSMREFNIADIVKCNMITHFLITTIKQILNLSPISSPFLFNFGKSYFHLSYFVSLLVLPVL